MEAAIGKLDPALQLIILMASLSLIPFIVVGMTSFLRYIIVLSILKTALGTQQVPPAVVLVGMALIMTFYTMSPVFSEMYQRATPIINQKGNVVQVFQAGSEPLKEFMMRQTRQSDIAFFVELNRNTAPDSPKDLSIWEVAPAFMISELRTAFEIGFVIFAIFTSFPLVRKFTSQ